MNEKETILHYSSISFFFFTTYQHFSNKSNYQKREINGEIKFESGYSQSDFYRPLQPDKTSGYCLKINTPHTEDYSVHSKF